MAQQRQAAMPVSNCGLSTSPPLTNLPPFWPFQLNCTSASRRKDSI